MSPSPSKAPRSQDLLVGKGEQPRPQGQQVPGRLPLSTARDVERRQRSQRLRVVPVVEMASVPFQGCHRLERLRGTLDQPSGRQVAEVVGGQVRQSSASPMLVGDVRCATTDTGCSCTLSGGSQWSSGPTKVSKKAQVLRESLRRKTVWSAVSRAAARRRQRPAEPPDESREAIQRARMGLATASAAGRKSAR